LRHPIRTSAVCAIFAIGALAGSAPSAAAALSATADRTWMTNGNVYAVVRAGDRIYIGGRFTQVSACAPTASCPTKTVDALNVAALDATTGAAIPGFRPQVQGTDPIVWALAVLGDNLFIGGQFDAVDGTARLNLAAVNLDSGALDTAINTPVGVDESNRVRGMVATSSRLYIAGGFNVVGGQPRARLASLTATGQLDDSWKPRTDGITRSLGLTCDSSGVILGGAFRQAAGTGGSLESRKTLAIVDAATGALDPWTPPADEIPNGVTTYDLDATCSQLFVGYGGTNWIYGYDLTRDTDNLSWKLQTGGNVQAVAVRGSQVLFGGHFSQVSLLGTNSKVKRVHFAVVDLDGHVQSDWVPSFGGQIHTGPWDILATGSQIYVGGGFTEVSGDRRWCIARFTDTPTV
jgi:hypothetical protein